MSAILLDRGIAWGSLVRQLWYLHGDRERCCPDRSPSAGTGEKIPFPSRAAWRLRRAHRGVIGHSGTRDHASAKTYLVPRRTWPPPQPLAPRDVSVMESS